MKAQEIIDEVEWEELSKERRLQRIARYTEQEVAKRIAWRAD
jgi:hypothetical protein